MSILNVKFLLAVLVCTVSVAMTDAAGVRGQDLGRRQDPERRALKSSKGKSKPKTTSGSTGTNASTNTFVQPTPATLPPVLSFALTCPTQYQTVKSCVMNNGGSSEECDQCVLGLSTLKSVTIAGLNSCSNPNIGGGRCKGCYDQVRELFNCGAGTSFGVVTTDTNVTGTTNTVTGSTNSVEVTDETTSTPPPPPEPSGFAPITQCPFEPIPVSGDACTVRDGFAFLECFYPNRLKCTCRADDTSGWNCLNF